MCSIVIDGHVLLATGGDDGWVRLWDPVDGECRYNTRVTHQICYSVEPPVIRRLRATAWGDTTVLAVEAEDDDVSFWDPVADHWFRPPQRLLGEFEQVIQIGWEPVPLGGRELIAVAQQEMNKAPERTFTLRLAGPDTCRYTVPLAGPPSSMLVVTCDESPVLVLHDEHAAALESRKALTGALLHRHSVDADSSVPLCAVAVDDASLVAVPASDGQVTLWDPVAGVVRRTVGRAVRATAMAGLTRGGRGLIAVAGLDGVLSVWDVDTGQRATEVRLPHPATALVVTAGGELVAGHRGGMTAIALPRSTDGAGA